VAIPPTFESAPAPAALIDRDQLSIVELRASWEHVEWRPSSQLLDDFALPFGSRRQ